MLVKLIVIPSGAGLGALEARACAQLILLHTHRHCHHLHIPPPTSLFSGIGEVAVEKTVERKSGNAAKRECVGERRQLYLLLSWLLQLSFRYFFSWAVQFANEFHAERTLALRFASKYYTILYYSLHHHHHHPLSLSAFSGSRRILPTEEFAHAPSVQVHLFTYPIRKISDRNVASVGVSPRNVALKNTSIFFTIFFFKPKKSDYQKNKTGRKSKSKKSVLGVLTLERHRCMWTDRKWSAIKTITSKGS